MREHVAVRMTGEAARVIERDASEHERRADVERVRIDADPDAVAHRITSGSSSRLEIETASGGGCVQEPPGPAANVHRGHAGRQYGHDIVVDPVADVRDLGRLQATLRHDAVEELRRRLRDAPAVR